MFVSYAVLSFSSLLVVAIIFTGIFNIGNGRPVFIYNLLDLKRTTWSGSALGEGKHTIVFDFKSDGPGLGKGGTGTLLVDGKEVATNYMEHCTPITFPEDESFDIGKDTRTGVSLLKYRYDSPFEFTGIINKVTFHLEPQHLTDETDRPVREEDGKNLSAIADTTGVEN